MLQFLSASIVALDGTVEQEIDDALCGFAVAVEQGKSGHILQQDLIFEESPGGTQDEATLAADELGYAGFDAFGSLGLVPADEHGFTDRRGFFLQTTRVSDHERRTFEDADEFRVGERSQEPDVS